MAVTKERVENLIKGVLEKKNIQHEAKAYITGAKEEIGQFMKENDLVEYKGKYGTVKVADSSREHLDKEKVETAIGQINDKEIDHIEIKDLLKVSDVHSINIKANKEAE